MFIVLLKKALIKEDWDQLSTTSVQSFKSRLIKPVRLSV